MLTTEIQFAVYYALCEETPLDKKEAFTQALRQSKSIRGIELSYTKNSTIVTITTDKTKALQPLQYKELISDILKGVLQNTHIVKVKGMVCGACEVSIRNILTKKTTFVNADSTNYTVSFAPKEGCSYKQVKDAIEDAGFEVEQTNPIEVEWLDPANVDSLHCDIKSDLTRSEAEKIKSIIQKIPGIFSCEIDIKVNLLTVKYFPRQWEGLDKLNKKVAIVSKLNKTISSYFKDNRVDGRLRLLLDEQVKEKNEKAKLKQYFYLSGLNALYGLFLVCISQYVPPPVTALGQWFGLGLGAISANIMYFSAKDIYKDAWLTLIGKKHANMNTLIALGTLTAWINSVMFSVIPFSFPAGALSQFHFLAVHMILGIVNFGRGVLQVAKEDASKQLLMMENNYESLQPKYVCRKDNNQQFIRIPIEEVNTGDIIRVRCGNVIPVDATVVTEGVQLTISSELLTGEPAHVKKTQDSVLAGSEIINIINQSGSPSRNIRYVEIRADRAGKKSSLNDIIERVKSQQVQRTTSDGEDVKQSSIDRIARVFVPTILSIAAISGLSWLALGPQPALPWMLQSVMSVLLCACPCALGLAAPTAQSIAIYKLLGQKILLLRPDVIDKLGKVDTYVFDKTGTLTIPTVSEQEFTQKHENQYSRKDILEYVASLENCFKEKHPIAQVLYSICQDKASSNYVCENPRQETGQGQGIGGVSGDINGKKVIIGNISLMKEYGINVQEFEQTKIKHEKSSLTTIYIAIKPLQSSNENKKNKKQEHPVPDICVGAMWLKHDLREDAIPAIKFLRAQGKDFFICTGDTKASTQRIAKELMLKTNEKNGALWADQSPEDKEKRIKELKAQGRVVAMVGDGFNDLKAMCSADVTIALGGWTYAANKADIALQRLNLKELFLIVNSTDHTIKQNLYWSLLYNLISIVAASGLLYPLYGIVLNPVVASLSMAFSSVFVVLNSVLLEAHIKHALAPDPGQSSLGGRLKSTWEKLKSYGMVIGGLFVPSWHHAENTPKEMAPDMEMETVFEPDSSPKPTPTPPPLLFQAKPSGPASGSSSKSAGFEGAPTPAMDNSSRSQTPPLPLVL